MNLPIDLVPGAGPPKFKWKQTVTTPIGIKTVENTGSLPATVEGAVVALILLAKRQAQEFAALKRTHQELAERVKSHDTAPPTPTKKGKG